MDSFNSKNVQDRSKALVQIRRNRLPQYDTDIRPVLDGRNVSIAASLIWHSLFEGADLNNGFFFPLPAVTNDLATVQTQPVPNVLEAEKCQQNLKISEIESDQASIKREPSILHWRNMPKGDDEIAETENVEKKLEKESIDSIEAVSSKKQKSQMVEPFYQAVNASQMYSYALEDDDDDDDLESEEICCKKAKKSTDRCANTLTQAYVYGLEDAYEDDEMIDSTSQFVEPKKSPSASISCSLSSRPQIVVWPWQNEKQSDECTKMLENDGSRAVCNVAVDKAAPEMVNFQDNGDFIPPPKLKPSVLPLKNKVNPEVDYEMTKNPENVEFQDLSRQFVPPSKVQPPPVFVSPKHNSGCNSDSVEEASVTQCQVVLPSVQSSTVCPWVNLPKLSPTVPWRRQRRMGLCRPYQPPAQHPN